MRLDGTWAIESGGECFVLVQTKPGVNNKTKLPCTTEVKTYHPSLRMCAKAIANTQVLDALTHEVLEHAIEFMASKIEQLVEEINKLPIQKVSE